MNPDPSMSVSVGMAGRARGAPARARSAQDASDLLRGDEELVAVLDPAAVDARALEPGAVGRAEILDEPALGLLDDRGVLARDLRAVHDQVAVLPPAAEAAVLRDLVDL